MKTGSRRRALAHSVLWLALGAPCVLPLVLAPGALAQTAARTIEGKVLNGAEAPLPGSIIYLQDQKTNIVKTYVATADGGYRFGQLPMDTDYLVWAEYKGQKSKNRLVSSFDTKTVVTQDFRIGK